MQEKLWDRKFRMDKGAERGSFMEKHTSLLSSLDAGAKILDLGCGDGMTAQYLHNLGFNVVAADFSKEALKIVNDRCPQIRTLCFDMTGEFPFGDETFDLVVANLSTHYFSEKTTKEVYLRIFDKLKKGGFFVFRVNSYREFEKKSEHDILEVVEKDYYRLRNGKVKRFFSVDTIKPYLTSFAAVSVWEEESQYGASKKYAVVGVAQKAIG